MGSRPLELEEYTRYGRQMIMPDFGLPGEPNTWKYANEHTGQQKLKTAVVAVVGAGGLGCPVLQYLAGAGVGEIIVIDHDEVSVSNLHRQILHTTERVGMNKAESACLTMRALNPHVKCTPKREAITPSTAVQILGAAHIIVDCTDRPLTRYLLSDTAVMLNLPLVSGAAISSAGQWAVYGGQKQNGEKRACYRCMWPQVVADAGRCEEVGVLGFVTGIVGAAMAGEVISLLTGKDDEPLLHLLHFGSNPLVRTIRIRKPSNKCIACGPNATILDLEAYPYDEFCAGPTVAQDEIANRISAIDLDKALKRGALVIDTRPQVEFEICSIPGTINISLSQTLKEPLALPRAEEVIFVCRRGNDSQLAASALRSAWAGREDHPIVTDVKGGLVAWARDVDPTFPLY